MVSALVSRARAAQVAVLLVAMLVSGPALAPASAQSIGTIQPPFDASYTLAGLGPVPGLPNPYGGLTFLHDNPNVILIGGAANSSSGLIYQIEVTRDSEDHITGFVGTAEVLVPGAGAFNDGGVVYGPDGVLFLARWPVDEIGQIKPGVSATEKVIDLVPFGIGTGASGRGPGGLMFVPDGFPGAGQLKLAGYGDDSWYTVDIQPDGTGFFDVTGATKHTNIPAGAGFAGLEGVAYVPPGSPVFDGLGLQLLVAEFAAGNVAAYEIDANGDPIPATRTVFIGGLSGAEGAAIDPVTGDLLFSTFGTGADQVVRVEGFAPPASTETPRSIKEDSVAKLQALLPTGDPQADQKIEKAIGSIEDSLTPEYWVDDSTLDPKHGKQVFDEERHAVTELTKKVTIAIPEAQDVVAALVFADELLAQKAIDDATAAGGNPRYLAKAAEAMAEAAAEWAGDNPQRAIYKYRKAWSYATKST